MGSSAVVPPVVLNNHYSGFSLQYIRRLLRTCKLAGLKTGQVWLIDMKSFEAYLAQAGSLEDHRFGPKQ